MSSPIEDYALIGDGNTGALVCRDGSIDWLCWPRFDSDACFAALLGAPENGRWAIAPAMPGSVSRRYQQDTLVLETEHTTQSGTVRVTDFMPVQKDGSAMIRIVEGLAGSVPMRMELSPRANYGATPPWFESQEEGFIGHVGPSRFVVAGTLPMRRSGSVILSEFNLVAGESLYVTLQYSGTGEGEPAPIEPQRALSDTAKFWRQWIGKFDKATSWPEPVKRSLITLKALIYWPSGGVIAALTTSLPEAPGGKLNWDYRFSWIRDAAFTLDALLNAGFQEEARAWRNWILRTVGGEPRKLRIMYRVNGERHIPEFEIDWLAGYDHAKPVRVGNGASTQHQADVYGELLNAMHLATKAGIDATPNSIEIETKIVEYIEESWREPGAGLWESRGTPRHYVYSRVMAWVGLDRFLRSPANRAHAGDKCIMRWEALRERVHADICRQGFHPGLNRFVEYYGGHTIDASLLLLPLVGFLSIDDPRIAATIAAIERDLTQDGLVRRKKPKGDDAQGTFIACTLWLADCQTLQGRHEDARKTFERVLAIQNDVGLLSEEYNVPAKRLAGNFPQALSHLALVTTAIGLEGAVLQHGGG